MKVINVKDLPDGGADIEFEFDSQEEHESYLKAAKEKNLTLEDFLIQAIQIAAENVIKENDNG